MGCNVFKYFCSLTLNKFFIPVYLIQKTKQIKTGTWRWYFLSMAVRAAGDFSLYHYWWRRRLRFRLNGWYRLPLYCVNTPPYWHSLIISSEQFQLFVTTWGALEVMHAVKTSDIVSIQKGLVKVTLSLEKDEGKVQTHVQYVWSQVVYESRSLQYDTND